ncbi:fimbria/pilus periplasmic chaperone [Aestuariibacter sp. AA17]|uniref:Fimbria/pilus periplasmic chaperone n=1 Tax=Fluctibacter corallii TaxID=2984329 RepID=A0ABT3AB95_9ALTE|nr:fimbria/pilus periplasmic chaperone [Aestuariibacter sp. AA17]MCV2885898.1 fimbria/pilus periplasmic chaperone [Aestuariibacter sp. AA17]
MLKKYVSLTTLLTLLMLTSSLAWSNLLIYPVRVSFDEQERSATLTLTNTSQQTNTYRLEWQENKALSEGGYTKLSEEEAKRLPIASPMLRFSPRQVTLKPGQRQVIKLSLRRPRNLDEGEYRSHILFKALPPKQTEEQQRATAMQINMVMSFAVPITIQQGRYDASVSLEDATIHYSASKQTGHVSLNLVRQGIHSASGNISAYWTPKGGKERLLAKVADFNAWTELSEIESKLIWAGNAFTPADGTLRVVYEGVRDFSDNTYFEETITVRKSDIKKLP